MFESLASSPLGFWIVASLLAAADSIAWLKPGEFTFRIVRRVNVRIRVADFRFLLRGREPVMTLLAYPTMPFVVCSAQAPPQGVADLRRALFGQKSLEVRFGGFSLAAGACMLLVFVVGPALSLQYGIVWSLLMVWPVVYLIAFVILAVISWRKQQLALKGQHLATIWIELLVCPFLVMNIWKKMLYHQARTFNVNDLAEHFAHDRSAAAHVRASLAQHFAEAGGRDDV